MTIAAMLPLCAADAGRGRMLFEQGRVAGRELQAHLRGSPAAIAAQLMACVNCHGAYGEGKREAGITVPPLTAVSSVSSLRRAVVEGLDADGRSLSPVMPTYALTPSELEDVLAHLRLLSGKGSDTPGVTASEVRIGFPTGRGGHLSASIETLLRAAFHSVNERGGIYGRRLNLVVMTSNNATAPVLATVASLDAEAIDPETASVGPLTHGANTATAFALTSSIASQVEALAAHLLQRGITKVQAVRASGPLEAEAFDALAKARSLHIVSQVSGPRFNPTADAQAVLFFGAEQHLPGVIASAHGLPVATLHSCAGRTALRLTAQQSAHLILTYPALMPADLDLAALQAASGGSISNAPAQTMALAAATVLIESLKRAGRDLNRPKLRQALESLNEFRTGLIPPVTFTAARHQGVRGAYMVSISDSSYSRLSDWIDPGEMK